MSYFAPYINTSGVHIPSYSEIRDSLIASFKNIYGQDLYLENDAQDYQMISAFANMLNDTNQAMVNAYNSLSPVTATNQALDNIVAINGITRKTAVDSTAILTITGTQNTVINNGIATDVNGYSWSLPSSVTIPTAGTIDVTATCNTSGAISASAGQINIISTPVYGWASVTNKNSVTIGTTQETDSSLRQRQTVAVANPSQSIFNGILSAVQGVDGVTKARGYENTTDLADSNGVPAHSVCFVVEGGLNIDIATAIYLNKTPGVGTYGSTTVNINAGNGLSIPINFYIATYSQIYVKVGLTGLTGYNSDTVHANIKTNIANYINSLQIGATIYQNDLFTPIIQAYDGTFAVNSIQISTDNFLITPPSITIAFNKIAQITASNIAFV